MVSQCKITNKEKYIIYSILLESIILPWLFLSHTTMIFMAVFCLYLFLRFIKKNNLSILVVLNLFFLCPIEVVYVDISSKLFWLFLVVRLCYAIELLLNMRTFCKDSFFSRFLMLLLFACLYDAFINLSFNGIASWFQRILYLIVPFFVILKLDFREIFLFKFGDIVFVVTFLYLIGQWIGIYPYEELRLQQLAQITWKEEYIRFGGLPFNSLCLSVILLFEAVSVWSRFILYGKMNYFLLIPLIISLLLTISKTAFIGFILISLCGLYAIWMYQRRIKLFFLLICSCVLVFIFINYFFQDLLTDNLSRLTDASNSISHRASAFDGVSKIFFDNPFGVGEKLSYLLDTKYRPLNWIVGFGTLDNFFLTMIGKYGVFSFLYIILYTYGFFYALKYYRNNRKVFYCIGMLYLCIVFISFSFNWESYASIHSFICLFSALYIKILQNKKQMAFLSSN